MAREFGDFLMMMRVGIIAFSPGALLPMMARVTRARLYFLPSKCRHVAAARIVTPHDDAKMPIIRRYLSMLPCTPSGHAAPEKKKPQNAGIEDVEYIAPPFCKVVCLLFTLHACLRKFSPLMSSRLFYLRRNDNRRFDAISLRR